MENKTNLIEAGLTEYSLIFESVTDENYNSPKDLIDFLLENE